ncbi:AMP-binding protein [Mycobacterium sp. CVI_P3]|uniref:AMP-binding protein n=1 Tax=Mycobacterium pinniadriaticum TaxID=2994102 RepID=A0ABT3SC40_9MYCO|nr:long-chain fatty acid--CoA ligase [Mycobacterium pinniadriaticum]MCX2930675.1 AMP-binding protein [Mycobacterium pinniadriaticum]MCX2937099.1 AMP-binding protein [Mycobacterium pinniadriaticum]
MAAENPGQHWPATLCEAFDRTVGSIAGQTALRSAEGDTHYTYAEYRNAVADVASALYERGIRRHDTVVLMFENRPVFHIVDAAVMHLGAVACSIYNTSPAGDIAHIVASSGARIALCESGFAPRILTAAPELEVICTDRGVAGTQCLDDLARATDFDFDAQWRAVEPDDVLTLIYTSGTTGKPKAVELTHRAIVAETFLVAEVLEFRSGDRVPSALPMAHAAQRWGTHYTGMALGLEVICVADLSTMGAHLIAIQPDIWGTVPRVLEKMVAALRTRLDAEPDAQKRALVASAVDIGQRYAKAQSDVRFSGGSIPSALAEQRAGAEPILAGLRAAIGLGRIRWLMVGAAPTAPHVHEYLSGLGLDIVEVWGMSELSSAATVNPPGAQKVGTVGRPLREVEVSLADDGEVLVRGPIAMRGYRGDPAATAAAVTADGWLRTGDLGVLDDQGYLSLVGRKKELIVNSAGKNISPAKVEAAIKAESPLIGSVMAVGDARPYLTALVVLDPDELVRVAAQNGLSASEPEKLVETDTVRTAVAEAIDRANTQLARVEQIKTHTVLPRFWLPDSEELTPTLKLKRHVISQKYRDQIEGLYASAAAAR